VGNDSAALREEVEEVRARPAAQAAAQSRRRQRPAESLHDDENKRLNEDRNSEVLNIELHGIDLTTDATEYRRYSKLDAPDPMPGYVQRWIRVRLGGKNDPTNAYRQFQEGWRPRPIGSVSGGHLLPTIQLGQFGECIGVGDSILCQRPRKIDNQARDEARARRKSQTASTETALDSLGDQHGVPVFKRKVTTVGIAPRVAADD
jgi:hypothetical protein